MIDGMNDGQYWESLVQRGDSHEETHLVNMISQLKKDGHETLALDYQLRLRRIASHNDVLRDVGSMQKKGNDQLAEGRWMIGKLIYKGWMPPKGLILTDRGLDVLAVHQNKVQL